MNHTAKFFIITVLSTLSSMMLITPFGAIYRESLSKNVS